MTPDEPKRQHLLHIIDHIDSALVLLDEHGTVLAANRTLAHLLRCDPEALLHRPWAELCAQPDVPFPGLWLLDALQSEQPLFRREYAEQPDGSLLVLDMYAFPMQSQPDRAPGQHALRHLVVHILDMTQQLQREADSLQMKQLMHGRSLTALLSHQINTPLQTIQLSLDLLREASVADRSLLAEQAQAEIEEITSALQRLKSIYHLDTDDLGWIDVTMVLERVLLLLGSALMTQHVLLERQGAARLPLVQGYASAFTDMLFHILINAIEAMPDGGTLTVQTAFEPGDQCLTLTVADTGTGIAAEALPFVFNSFFTTKPFRAGLGLAMSRRVAAQHGATITLDSIPGQGTTVTIQFALKEGDEPAWQFRS